MLDNEKDTKEKKPFEVVIEQANELLTEVKKITNARAIVREWTPPRHRRERRRMYEKNPQCFLKVEKTKTGEVLPKYPVCPRGSSTPSCAGAIAAILRGNINHDKDVVEKAYKLAKEVCPKDVDIPDPYYMKKD